MKNIYPMLYLCSISIFSVAQNVGIGTVTPREKLEVMNPLRSTVKISSSGFNDTTEIQLTNISSANQGTGYSIKNIREEGLLFSSFSDLPANNSSQSMVIKPTGYIGLNEASPLARLSLSGAETSNNGVSAAIALRNTASSNAWYIRAGGPGTSTPNGGLSIADNVGYHFVMDALGNLGLGMTPIAARLHINGALKIQGANTLELGAGVAGKEINAGKIIYNGFGTNALAIVGAGTNSTNRSVYFFAEGGTTFSGAVNVNGALRPNGNPGTAGQVLTSTGMAAPVWQNSSYSNTTRFAVSLQKNATKSGDAVIDYTYYNLDPTNINITVGGTEIIINKSGLYRFEIGSSPSLNFSSATTHAPTAGVWFFFGPPRSIQIIDNKLMTASNSSNTFYSLSEKNSIEIYITAPADISVYHTFGTLGIGGGTSTHNFAGFLIGHLISE